VIPDKLPQLLKMLERSPSDAFLLYGVGMEHKKRSDWPQAIEYFSKAIDVDPNYCYAYYQRGQVQEQSGDTDSAKQSYQCGIDAAKRTNDDHARSELEMALSML
jgi:tetratricopeptide (TPR) repeat protein